MTADHPLADAKASIEHRLATWAPPAKAAGTRERSFNKGVEEGLRQALALILAAER